MLVVTGAAGFIGSNIVAALNAEGRSDIVAVDNAGIPASTGNLKGLAYRFILAKEELLPWLEENAADAEAIIHMGACSDTTNTNRAFMMRNNFEYTQELWTFCARRKKRFVYASSAATYGDGSQGYDDAADPSRLKPLNLYGESKQRFDLWALQQAETPAGWAGLKFFNVYGPGEKHKGRMASVAFHAYNQIKADGWANLFKSDRPDCPDGGQKRDFIYVEDAAAATLQFLKASAERINGLFNVGTGKARTFADLASAVFRALQREPKIRYIPMPDDLKGKYQYFTEAKIEKLRASGFTAPMFSLEDGVKDYVRGYLVWLS